MPKPVGPSRAEDLLAALDVRVSYDFTTKWNKQILSVYNSGEPEDTRLLVLAEIRAVFPIFAPGPTGAANAKQYPKGSGAFRSKEAAPDDLHGWYRLIIENDTAKLHDEGEDKTTAKLLWTGKGEQYELDGNWRVYFQ